MATKLSDISKLQRASETKEVKALRQQLLELQAGAQETASLGKLHQQLVALQLSEDAAVQKHAACSEENLKLQAQLLHLEKELEEKDEILQQHRSDAHSEISYLRKSLQVGRPH